MKTCKCSQVCQWNSYDYTFISYHDSIRNGNDKSWFTFVLNFKMCLLTLDAILTFCCGQYTYIGKLFEHEQLQIFVSNNAIYRYSWNTSLLVPKEF